MNVLEKIKALPEDTQLSVHHVTAIIQSLLAKEEDYDSLPTSKQITEEDLSKWLNVPVKTIQKWRLGDDGPKFVKLPKAVRYKVGVVKEWIDSRTVSNTTEATAKGFMKLETGSNQFTLPYMQYSNGSEVEFFQSLAIDDEPTGYELLSVACPGNEPSQAFKIVSQIYIEGLNEDVGFMVKPDSSLNDYFSVNGEQFTIAHFLADCHGLKFHHDYTNKKKSYGFLMLQLFENGLNIDKPSSSGLLPKDICKVIEAEFGSDSSMFANFLENWNMALSLKSELKKR